MSDGRGLPCYDLAHMTAAGDLRLTTCYAWMRWSDFRLLAVADIRSYAAFILAV